MTDRLNSIFARFLALAAFVWLAVSAQAQTVTQRYYFYKATASLPVISQGMNAAGNDFVYKYDRLLTKQIINLIRGREMNAKVPKNEILVVARPFAFPPPAPIFLMVVDNTKIDKTQGSPVGQDGLVLGTGAQFSNNGTKFVFGKGGGKKSIGIGTVATRATGDANNGLGENVLRAGARVSGPRFVATGVTGPFLFNKDGVVVDGLLAGGSLRSAGALLCEMDMEVDVTPVEL